MQLMKGEVQFLSKYLCLDVELGNGKVRQWVFYKGRQYGLYTDYDSPITARNTLFYYRINGGFPHCSPHYYPWQFGAGKVGKHRRIEYDKNSDD